MPRTVHCVAAGLQTTTIGYATRARTASFVNDVVVCKLIHDNGMLELELWMKLQQKTNGMEEDILLSNFRFAQINQVQYTG